MKNPLSLTLLMAASIFAFAAKMPAQSAFTNSLGMRMLPVAPGKFIMGETNETPREIFKQPDYLNRGDWDEHPAHEIEITKPFHIAEVEVTIEQFKQFRATYRGDTAHAPYASGISWHEADAFCKWLGKREGKNYRLPTEAEWEYACRAGTGTLFSSGGKRPAPETANAWGLKNMHTGVSEWCSDWHAEYSLKPKTDPVGAESGFARVIRGGGLDNDNDYYARSANRAGMPPNFPALPLEQLQDNSVNAADTGTAEAKKKGVEYKGFLRDTPNRQGQSAIGFRVVCAPAVKTSPSWNPPSFAFRGVVATNDQTRQLAAIGPDPKKPWFRKRFLLPTPPENTPNDQLVALRALDMPRAFLKHQHSPSLVACDNGDLLAVYFTAVGEMTPDVALMVARLRFGAEQWDMPDILLDIPDVDDHAPLLWNDNGRLWLFWGMNKYNAGYPFQYITSDDNGATWSPVQFPNFPSPVGGYSAQPIANAFRSKNGDIHVASDGIGPESVLWRSRDNGVTWEDPGGRTAGRHTVFVELRDGSICGMGGKSTNIDDYMPKVTSTDGGKTWSKPVKTPFCHLGSNQRPSFIRLASGRLFFACDLQSDKGKFPATLAERGAIVALSDDEGQTWTMRKLPGAQRHESPKRSNLRGGGETIGYSVARQSPNGNIQLITSMNSPCLHFEFNEAWILQGDPAIDNAGDDTLMRSKATRIEKTNTYTVDATLPDGEAGVRVRFTGGIADDGRFLLHGRVRWVRPDGTTEYEASYNLGELTGREALNRNDGDRVVQWMRNHKGGGVIEQSTYWPDGTTRTTSRWKDKKADGPAILYQRMTGNELYRVEFKNGRAKEQTGAPGEN